MRPSKEDQNRPRGAISKAPAALLRALWRLGAELFSIVREMLRIPAQLFMRVAELAGAVVLAAWHLARPFLEAALRGLTAALRFSQREVTPLRATLAVAVVAAIGLGASQFADYSEVAIGTPQYTGVDSVAPAPVVESSRTGEAHAWLGLVLALGALAALGGCLAGHWRLARLLVPIGLLAILLGLIVDMPKGLDEGDLAIQYEGAAASLLAGFWAQLATGAVLVAVAPLLGIYSRTGPAPAARATALPRWSLPSLRRRRPVTPPVRGGG